MLIDIHTHQVKKTIPGETYIYSRYTDFFVPVDCDYLSMGIHPWYTETDFERQLGELEKAISKTNVIALGEAGIDRSRGLPVEKQIKVFIRQIEIAEKYSKPVIIHCVRAFPEVISIRKELKPSVPMIIHGFRGNKETAAALVRSNFYLSFGAALIDHENIQDVFRTVPDELLLLETDDAHAIPLRLLYEKAALLRSADPGIFQAQVLLNAEKCFRVSF